MRISTQNTKIQWDPHTTPDNSPANMFPSICNSQGSDQQLPCQFRNGEAVPAFHAPFEPVIESQQAIFGSHELPQLSVQPLESLDLTENSNVAGYDSPTSHLFASPIWPPDENVYTGRPEVFSAANENTMTYDWGLMDGLESFCEPLSQIKEICGISKEMQILQYATTPSPKRRKQKSNLESTVGTMKKDHECGLRGCGRVYRRIEHLQRHIKM
ncbi:hypothetical protein FANTH_9401 [Fusarium anthophilum]|uniref:C2H2-type domain-containing protein n=1 Tax=Fusarium anthophilum TaxID=48485 RepID=A0A8H4Z7P6_9HYPO|nr:hypothetical protein FANTH_9401 [Fusarium anthophilum]